MSLLEWIFERRNPGPIGTVEGSAPEDSGAPPSVKTARAIVALLAVGGVVYLVSKNATTPTEMGIGIGAFVAYVALASFLRPKPDYSNVGLLGGIVDHPLRWSDDYNRVLMFLQILLLPGRLVGAGLIDAFTLFSGKRTLRL